MSSTQYTFGGNYDRGGGFYIIDNSNAEIVILADGALGTPIYGTGSNTFRSITSGSDKHVALTYSTVPGSFGFRDFNGKGEDLRQSGFGRPTGNTDPITAPYPYSIGYGNDIYMIVSTISSSITTDVYTSQDGFGWTHNDGVVPIAAANYFPSKPVYNPDDGRWAFVGANGTQIFYSDNGGTTWTIITQAGATFFDIAYGNGTWVIAGGQGTVWYSDDNLSTLNSVNINTGNFDICYGINYNPFSQRFWAGGGDFDGSVYRARINYSLDGLNWTNVYNGNNQMYCTQVIADDNGNVVAIGRDYSGGQFNTTANYMYSTDNGSTWNLATMQAPYGHIDYASLLSYKAQQMGTPPAGDPPAPTYSVNVNTTSVNENGDDIIWTINTTNIDDGTTLYWRLDPFPTDGYSDFTTTEYAGSVTINGNVGTVTKTTIADSRTEGTDSVRLLLKVGGSGADNTTVAESDFVTISDTSQTPPPPSRQQPTISSGSNQSGSVPATVLSQQEFPYDFQITNATPYSYTIDFKHNEDFLNVSAGDIFSTISVNPNTITSFNGNVVTFPAGAPLTEVPNFNFSLRAEARNTSGTPDNLTFNISRTPFNQLIFPSSGTTIAQIGGPQTITIELSGGEPNSNWIWSGTNSGGSTFNSSGNDSVQYIPPRLPFTASWTLTWIDGTTSNYTLNFT